MTEVGGLYIVREGESLETAYTGNWGYGGSSEAPRIVDPAGSRSVDQLRFRIDASGVVDWLGAIDCGD